jgi:acetyl esterase/lipase
MRYFCLLLLFAFSGLHSAATWADELKPAYAMNVWPGRPPGETKELPPEVDTTKETDGKVAGKRVARIGNVSTPTLEVFKPDPAIDTGAAVIVCPGGGHYILAYDLEGTEVAAWLNRIGVTAIVLKYRVPFRDEKLRWKAAVQDAQRSVRLARAHAEDWKLDPKRIGMLGFSAGGQVAALTAGRHANDDYDKLDKVDELSSRPDFSVLIYSGGLTNEDHTALREEVVVDKTTPPSFLVHTYDDGVTPLSSLLYAAALKRAGVGAELHMYAAGGHGYGLRETDLPVTKWPAACEAWLRQQKWMTK